MLRRLLVLPLCLLLLATQTFAETRAKDRVALVFGMASYRNVTALKNTISDASNATAQPSHRPIWLLKRAAT